MVVTTSTTICVSARSGAENQTNVRQVTRPAPPINVTATSRWNFAITAAPTRAYHADDPEEHERIRRRHALPVSPFERDAPCCQEREKERNRDDREHLSLKAPRADEPECRSRPACEPDDRAIEQSSAIEPFDERRVLEPALLADACATRGIRRCRPK